jgi:hypothetical protein
MRSNRGHTMCSGSCKSQDGTDEYGETQEQQSSVGTDDSNRTIGKAAL